MEIRWFGQACFLVKSKDGSLVIDPFSEEIGLKLPKLSADIVLVTHQHPDHNNVSAVLPEKKEKPFVISGPGEYEISGITIWGLASFHDKSEGAERGTNTIYKIRAEEMNLCHLGDLGHILSDNQLESIGEVDILFVPVGGVYTIDGKEAVEVIGQIEPKIVIPMHYQIPGLASNLGSLDSFARQEGVVDLEAKDFLKISKNDLPSEERETVILKPKAG